MISDVIHVSFRKLLELEEDHGYIRDLDGSLEEAVKGSTQIDILGGYYSEAWFAKFLKKVPWKDRSGCRIRIAVGLDAGVRITQHWEAMTNLKAELRRLGFRDVKLFIVQGHPHFHTKLFHFLKRTRHVWFVGSANPGSERHELMVSLSGRHQALQDYMSAAFRESNEVRGLPPRNSPRTSREFFLTGYLVHKPHRPNPFTFDAFRLEPEDRARIMARLTVDVVPHARPNTSGFAFSLRSAVGFDDDNEHAAVPQVRLRQHSVDTVLGAWIPRRYREEILDHVGQAESVRREGLTRLAHVIRGEGAARVMSGFEEYVDGMERLLRAAGLEPRRLDGSNASFQRFLTSRQKMLSDEETIQKLARHMQVSPMPDIWSDRRAVSDFESSFFDDVAYRLASGPRHRVIRALAEGLGRTGRESEYVAPAVLVRSLEKRLGKRPWLDIEWDC
ncbi:phospholipase D family protein [Neorhizobium sp. BT27B]|uniref:phospholipase D family protein n=1 Tax=Neorhizobium sp. BT27B TaxID=3142625 RepID=UPI003D273DC4